MPNGTTQITLYFELEAYIAFGLLASSMGSTTEQVTLTSASLLSLYSITLLWSILDRTGYTSGRLKDALVYGRYALPTLCKDPPVVHRNTMLPRLMLSKAIISSGLPGFGKSAMQSHNAHCTDDMAGGTAPQNKKVHCVTTSIPLILQSSVQTSPFPRSIRTRLLTRRHHLSD